MGAGEKGAAAIAAVGGDDRPSLLIGGGGGGDGHSECNAASNLLATAGRERERGRDGGGGSAEVSGVNEFGDQRRQRRRPGTYSLFPLPCSSAATGMNALNSI